MDLLARQGADDVERVQNVVQRVQVGLGDGLHQDDDRVVPVSYTHLTLPTSDLV